MADIDKIDNTLNMLNEHEGDLLLNALAKMANAYKENPTAQNLKEYTAAKQAVENYKARKQAEGKPEEQCFKNLLEVIVYLRDQGWKCSKSKIYEDQIKIDRQSDGTITKKDADKYAGIFLRRLDGSINADDLDPAEKLRWEIEIAKEKAEKLHRENEIERGIYLLRSDVEHMLAARAAYLKDNLGAAFIHSRASQIILLVNGDQTRIPDFVEFWLRNIEEIFNHYARPIQHEATYTPKPEGNENADDNSN